MRGADGSLGGEVGPRAAALLLPARVPASSGPSAVPGAGDVSDRACRREDPPAVTHGNGDLGIASS